jgi:hypothetical protein
MFRMLSSFLKSVGSATTLRLSKCKLEEEEEEEEDERSESITEPST